MSFALGLSPLEERRGIVESSSSSFSSSLSESGLSAFNVPSPYSRSDSDMTLVEGVEVLSPLASPSPSAASAVESKEMAFYARMTWVNSSEKYMKYWI